jgi:hypothetical protein
MTVRLYGCAVADQHVRGLVASLTADGQRDAIRTAEAISDGLARHAAVGALSPEMRDAVLRVMAKPPPSGLVALREALVNDQRARR